jgi:putative FmdB family regulatory protein
MPIYEYKCTECGSLFEVLQKVHDLPLQKCIRCGGKVQKAITAPAIQFKGSGWYITDYGDKVKKPDKSKKSPVSSPDKTKKGAQKKTSEQKKE